MSARLKLSLLSLGNALAHKVISSAPALRPISLAGIAREFHGAHAVRHQASFTRIQ